MNGEYLISEVMIKLLNTHLMNIYLSHITEDSSLTSHDWQMPNFDEEQECNMVIK